MTQFAVSTSSQQSIWNPMTGGSRWVFPGRYDHSVPMNSIRPGWLRLCSAAGVTALRPHDGFPDEVGVGLPTSILLIGLFDPFHGLGRISIQVPNLDNRSANFRSPPAGGVQSTGTTSAPFRVSSRAKLSSPTLTTFMGASSNVSLTLLVIACPFAARCRIYAPSYTAQAASTPAPGAELKPLRRKTASSAVKQRRILGLRQT